MRLIAAALVLATLPSPAQQPDQQPAQQPTQQPAQQPTKKPLHAKPSAKEHLVFTLIISRHGIRPPLTASDTLNTRASDPWPAWEVPLGHLTPHGAQALNLMGAYLRADLNRSGLLSDNTCPAPTGIYLYSDTDERNISSTRATFTAMLPNCPLPTINTFLPPATSSTTDPENAPRDPLFLPTRGGVPAPTREARAAGLRDLFHGDANPILSAAANPELNELAHILAPGQPAAKPILAEPVSLTETSATGPLAVSSSLIEDLLLEYINDKPLTEVGWGRLGTTGPATEATLRRLEPLHAKAFALATRSTFHATVSSSNMLSHLLATLEAATDAKALEPRDSTAAIGPSQTKLVYLSAHDSNLYGIAGLLNLHWTVDTVADDTPPDSQIVFELYQPTKPTKQTEPHIRLLYRAQTWNQLRNLTPLTAANPPAEVPLTPPGCVPNKPCPLSKFLTAARKSVDPAYVTALAPTQPAP